MQQTGTAGSYDLSSDYRYGYGGSHNEVRVINSEVIGYYQKSKKSKKIDHEEVFFEFVCIFNVFFQWMSNYSILLC